ncbi:hypothetical protein BST98_13425 [Photobacterium damselae]|nr:hypothetical protein BST98_13425 [Photobacterium damselae]
MSFLILETFGFNQTVFDFTFPLTRPMLFELTPHPPNVIQVEHPLLIGFERKRRKRPTEKDYLQP